MLGKVFVKKEFFFQSGLCTLALHSSEESTHAFKAVPFENFLLTYLLSFFFLFSLVILESNAFLIQFNHFTSFDITGILFFDIIVKFDLD